MPTEAGEEENEEQTCLATSANLHPINIDDFVVLRAIDDPSFSSLQLVEHRRTKALYALKSAPKRYFTTPQDLASRRIEKRLSILLHANPHPFLLPLLASFQSPTKIYTLTPYHHPLHLSTTLALPLPLAQARFYLAQITLALQHLHDHHVLYRHLVLEHILLTAEGNVQLTSYTYCKPDMYAHSRTRTFCGVGSNMAPELLLDQDYGFAVDWWALGVVAFEMLVGEEPFAAAEVEEMFERILGVGRDVEFPEDMDGAAVMFVRELLEREVEVRLGSGKEGAEEVMRHGFFDGMDWEGLMLGKVEAPFVPPCRDEERRLEQTGTDEGVDEGIPEAMQENFKGFDYCVYRFHE